MIEVPTTDWDAERRREAVLEALSRVWDPELALDVVSLGLVYDIRIDGDVVEIEALVKRLRSRMGQLSGYARVNGTIVLEGTMTFALGSREA